MTNYAYDGGRPTVGQAGAQQIGLEEQLSRLDKLEQVIAAERERLNRPSADSRDQPGRRSGDQYDPRSGDQQEPVDTLREVDVPGLETKVTESQREAWALGGGRLGCGRPPGPQPPAACSCWPSSSAASIPHGLSDAQSGGRTATNPFHPDGDDRSGCDIATSLREVSAQRLSRVDRAVIDLGPPNANGLQAPHLRAGSADADRGADRARRRGRRCDGTQAGDDMVKQHADDSAIERKHQARSDLDLHDDVIERPQAIGLAMRTTQRRSTEQPALVGRITEHLNELQQVVDQTRCTIPARAADPDDAPLVW